MLKIWSGYSGMTILVTGGAGYVGMNVVEALLARKDRVVLVDAGILPAVVQQALAPHGALVEVIRANICDPAAVEQVFAGRHIDGVIHCAAVTAGPAREASDPASSIEVNQNGTLNLLLAARKHAVRRFVVTSSAAVYGESLYRLQRLYEDISPAVPVSLYGITKFAAERMCVRLRELWSFDVVCARLGTLVGPWERATGVRDNFGTHSQLACFALKGETAILPQHAVRRDWVYSRDVAVGLIMLLDAKATRHAVYNLSAGGEWGGVEEWCERLKAAYPRFSYRTAAANEKPNIGYTDRDRCPLDIGRMVSEFGFKPHTTAEAYDGYLEWMGRMPSALV
ncbi:MAG: NAD(P)-dependent oxidoreductase [Betaproteobacteria bacterium]|nr:NAD(P)-dependent oxidoreductase [Betaproteobacteria bacterium]